MDSLRLLTQTISHDNNITHTVTVDSDNGNSSCEPCLIDCSQQLIITECLYTQSLRPDVTL